MMYVIDERPAVNVSGYYNSALQSAGRGSRRPDKSCCAPSRRCWIAVVVVAVLLQMLSLGGIGGLLELLRRATRPIEFVELVRDCSDCSRCYSCLSEDTGTTTRRASSWTLSRSGCSDVLRALQMHKGIGITSSRILVNFRSAIGANL